MGAPVWIIGNPGLGREVLSHTMTQGIVSNPRRFVEGQRYLQTDAGVNPGSSGSPVINDKGNVVGVMVIKAHIEAVGFAMPSDKLLKFIERYVRE